MQKQIVTVGNSEVAIKEFKGQRVVTFRDIDTVHERPEGTARKRFNDNKKRFVENVDFFRLTEPSEIRTLGFARPQGGVPDEVVLITEQGYLMVTKSLTDDLSWKVQRQLVTSYFKKEDAPQGKKNHAEPKRPSLTAVTSAAKFLTDLAGEAGCDRKIQLLAAKSFYNTNGYSYQLEIGADKQYWDTVHIARKVGICAKPSGKPADKAVNEIIRRIGITEEDYTDTWESKGNWQGTVRKYSDSVIERVGAWIADNDYPEDIDYRQSSGEMKAWHVTYQRRGVAERYYDNTDDGAE